MGTDYAMPVSCQPEGTVVMLQIPWWHDSSPAQFYCVFAYRICILNFRSLDEMWEDSDFIAAAPPTAQTSPQRNGRAGKQKGRGPVGPRPVSASAEENVTASAACLARAWPECQAERAERQGFSPRRCQACKACSSRAAALRKTPNAGRSVPLAGRWRARGPLWSAPCRDHLC